MPNTLAHIGVQSLIMRAGMPKADIKWVWASCLLPDLPWIAQRALRISEVDIARLDLRLYAIVQSSLFVTLILAAALALFSHNPRRTFTILSLGALLHLLLDATQIKWGNGALLTAPISWNLTHFDLYWPESWITLALSALGLLYAVYAILAIKQSPSRPVLRPLSRPFGAAALLATYLLLPLIWMQTVETANLHDVATLRTAADRTGQSIAIDRNTATAGPAASFTLHSWTGEDFTLQGQLPSETGKVSFRGAFVDQNTIAVTHLHVHAEGRREILTYLGILIIACWWLVLPWRRPKTGA